MMHWASTFPAKPSLSVRRSHCTLLYYSWCYDKLSILVVLHSSVEDVLRLSQNMGNNFGVVQRTLLNKLISLGLMYFDNVGPVIIMEWMLFFRNTMGKEERESAGRITATTRVLFTSMLVCSLSLSLSISLHFFLLLFVSSFSLFHSREQIQCGWNIVVFYLFVCICLFNAHLDRLFDHFCAGILKAFAVGLIHRRKAIKRYGVTMQWFTRVMV